MTKKECFEFVSGLFLTDELTYGLDHDDYIEQIREMRWQPFEDDDPEDVLMYIHDAADDLYTRSNK
jgi:hypothetical protein